MSIKPVSDLFLITYKDGTPYKTTRDAKEAVDAIGAGFKVEEFVSLENHRATMLQAEPVCTCPSGDGSLRWPCPVHPGNSPVIPDTWIPVSERLPERGDYLVTDGCDFDVQLFNGEEFIPGFVWEDKITHWMPLPATPQEVSHD